ncbi:MAG: TRAP-type mannitol/chloroaromatic compound transport system permease small subunit [Gammaproteobacteria bacterium]|jgi:TRAP-type mannitol/chloroaromatic compound transport system permease small subunit
MTWLNTITRVSKNLETVTEYSGKIISWLVLALVLLVTYDVSMRYLFSSGSIALQEMEWHLFAFIFLISAAYTFKHNDHVRLDLFYQSHFMNDYRRAWVNLFGGVFMLIPFCILIIYSAWPFVSLSYFSLESSPDPGGLPYRWLLKAVIPLGFALLLLQGIGDILKNLAHILRNKS